MGDREYQPGQRLRMLRPYTEAARMMNEHRLWIRCSTDAHRPAIARILADAFGPNQTQDFVELVNALLDDPTAQPLMSLLAKRKGMPVGHLLFTSVKVGAEARALSAAILAPLAVLSEHQSTGVGSALIREGLTLLAVSGVDLVFVLGHPGYYPKYGFRPAGVLGFQAPYPIAPQNTDALMDLSRKEGVRCSDPQPEPAELHIATGRVTMPSRSMERRHGMATLIDINDDASR